MLDQEGQENLTFHTGDSLTVKLEYTCDQEDFPVDFAVAFTRSDWVYCYGTRVSFDTQALTMTKKEGKVEVTFPSLTLLEGEYFIDARIVDDKNEIRDNVFSIAKIRILPQEPKRDNGIIRIDHQWNL